MLLSTAFAYSRGRCCAVANYLEVSFRTFRDFIYTAVEREREREGCFFMRFPLLASLWLSQRLGHCCFERYYGTVLRTLTLPFLAQRVIFVNLKQPKSAKRHNTDQLNNPTLKCLTV